ncbi:MAG: hypothetical protein HFG07_01750 [Oscillibacter sp.]|nr:hypothetical protein [Oscillibacter sp.]
MEKHGTLKKLRAGADKRMDQEKGMFARLLFFSQEPFSLLHFGKKQGILTGYAQPT